MTRMRRLDLVLADEPFHSSELALIGFETPVLDATVEGGAGSDDLKGTSGDDILIGHGGRDILFGDAGNDSFRYELLTDSTAAAPDLILDLAAGDRIDLTALQVTSYRIAQINGNITLTATTATGDLVVHSQNAIAVDNVLLGNSLTLTGTAGADQLLGANKNDVFRLETGGVDSAIGGAGNDGFYIGGALTGADRIDGGAGDLDQLALQGSYAALVLEAATFTGVEQFGFLSGSDTRFGAPGTELYSYSVTMHDGNVAAGQQLTVQFNTLLPGENVTFDGSAELDGSFFTFGGRGIDVLIGSQGSDRFFFGADGRFGASDRVDGQGGNDDQLGLQGDYSGTNAVVMGANSMSGIEILGMLSAGNSRFGSGSSDGFSYDVTMHDANVAAGARLIVQANALRFDAVYDERLIFDGSAETDGSFTIFSGNGADEIVGGAGADVIFARGGNDVITGGLGADTLRGQLGSDTFVYTAPADSGAAARDLIVQFEAGDRIDLSSIDAVAGGAGDAFTFIGEDAFSAAGQLRVVRDGTGWLVEGDVNGDGNADLVISLTTLDLSYTPSAVDFIL